MTYVPPKKKRHILRWVLGSLVGLIIFIVVLAVTVSGSTTVTSTSDTPIIDATQACESCTPEDQVPVVEIPEVVTTTITTTTNTLTVDPQVQEAIDAAQQYLDYKAFSRDGLIAQLDSPYGSDFSKSIATAAVDSLSVDYNAQAATAAQSYLDFTSFSCSGLIAQLDSAYGDQYTKAQATYGAHQTNVCG
jgi:flagellar basal body-associated protein FliL